MKRACSWVGGFYVLLKRAATTATRQLVVSVIGGTKNDLPDYQH